MAGSLMALYEFSGVVKVLDSYRSTVVRSVETTVLAATQTEALDKARAAFNADYDTFHKQWSHLFVVHRVRELEVPDQQATDA